MRQSKVWLFQNSLHDRWEGSSGEGTRTLDTADMSRMLYHLSYAAVLILCGPNIATALYHVNPGGGSLTPRPARK
jgi:hypothetical protein